MRYGEEDGASVIQHIFFVFAQLTIRHSFQQKINIFLISPQKHTLWYSSEAPCLEEIRKNIFTRYPLL